MSMESRELYLYALEQKCFQAAKKRVHGLKSINANSLFHLAHLIVFLAANSYTKERCSQDRDVIDIFTHSDLFDAAIHVESSLLD